MAVTQTVAFEILATVEKYRSGMAKMEGITAQAAAKAALRLERELVKGEVAAAKAAVDAAKKAGDAHEAAAKRAGKAGEDAAKGLEKGLKTIGGPIGGVADTVADLSETMELLASPTGLVVGLLAGAALAVTAFGVAALSGYAALGRATLAADEALVSLEGFKKIGSDFFPKVPRENLDSVENVNTAMTALTSIGERLTVVVGGNVAPAFEQAANVLVGLGLTAMECFEKFSAGRSLLHEFAVFLGTGVVHAALAAALPLGILAGGVLALSAALGIDLPDGAEAALKVLKRVTNDAPALAREIAEGAVTMGEQAVAATGLGEALEGVADKGAAFIGVQERATKAVEGAADAQAEAKRKADEAAEAQKKAAEEAAKWAHELALVQDGGDLTELNDRLKDIEKAEKDGAVTAVAATELRAAAVQKYTATLVAAEQKARDEAARTAASEIAKLKEVEAARREGLTNFQRGIEDTTASLKKAGWDEVTAEQAATMGAAFSSLASMAAPYLEVLDTIASAGLDKHTEALQSVQDRIDNITSLVSDLSEITVDAATLSGKALVKAYKRGEVAVEDLTEAQKEALKKDLSAQKEKLAKQAAFERRAVDDAFELQQGAAIAATIIAGLQGAIAAFQLGPIAGAVAAAGITALTAVNVGLISSTKPQYHAGGVGYPDEANSVTLEGEGWLNRQAVNDVGGPAAVNAMNAGHGASGGVTVVRIGRNEAREIARTDIRSNGIIPQTIKSIARRSGFGAGLSGRGVLA